MKPVKEYLVQLIDAETPAFVRVFEAAPVDKLDWKPDAKSKSAKELINAVAAEGGSDFPSIFGEGVINYDPMTRPVYATPAEAAAAFKAGMEKSKALILAMTDSDWDSESKMMMGGAAVWTSTKGEMALGWMLDMIHHRGQLSTYLRPMGGKVPSIYGPSADTNE